MKAIGELERSGKSAESLLNVFDRMQSIRKQMQVNDATVRKIDGWMQEVDKTMKRDNWTMG